MAPVAQPEPEPAGFLTRGSGLNGLNRSLTSSSWPNPTVDELVSKNRSRDKIPIQVCWKLCTGDRGCQRLRSVLGPNACSQCVGRSSHGRIFEAAIDADGGHVRQD